MKVKTQINKRITATEGKRSLQLEFDSNGDCTGVGSSLSYYKTPEDWSFYGKAILRILKELNHE